MYKIKYGGIIVWDNSERERYRNNPVFMDNILKRIEKPGPTPLSKDFTLTTFFKKVKIVH